MNFNELNLIEPIVKAITEMKYEEPSPIQTKTIPYLLEGKDVMGCAQTGSGKTAAFALPILQKLSNHKGDRARALIMTPTRELAIQICDNMKLYGKYLDLRIVSIFGGVNQEKQVEELEAGADIIVATPGRLMDLMKQEWIQLDQIEMLVLDEADRMLDMGFVLDIRSIVRKCPKDCQKLMFSATMPKPIERLADTILNDPETIMQDEVNSTVDTVQQFVYYVDEVNKLALLTSLLKSEEVKKAIVFTNKKYVAEKVMKELMKAGVRCRAIHSDKSQNSRQDAILQFKNNRITALIATDVAARGIDITKVSHVINYDIPDQAESYIHRIGRTGRAGEEGVAINFCSIEHMEAFKAIEEHIHQTIPQLTSEWPMKIFQKKVKQTQPRKMKEEDASENPLDIRKVKDVSLSGKPVKKRSKYQYQQQKFGTPKGKEGDKRSEKGFRGKQGTRGKSSYGKTNHKKSQETR